MTIAEAERKARELYKEYRHLKRDIQHEKIREFCRRHPEVVNDLIDLKVLPEFMRKEVK